MRPLLACVIILTNTVGASAQLTDPFTDKTTMGWQVGPASPAPPSGPINLALAKDAVAIPAGDSWQTYNLSFAAAVLPPRETGTGPTALNNLDPLRATRSPAPIFGGPERSIPGILATLGVDNTTAINSAGPVWVTVPEPATYLGALGMCGLVVLRYVRRRFRQR